MVFHVFLNWFEKYSIIIIDIHIQPKGILLTKFGSSLNSVCGQLGNLDVKLRLCFFGWMDVMILYKFGPERNCHVVLVLRDVRSRVRPKAVSFGFNHADHFFSIKNPTGGAWSGGFQDARIPNISKHEDLCPLKKLRKTSMLSSDQKGSRFSTRPGLVVYWWFDAILTKWFTQLRLNTGDSTHLRWVHPIDNPPSIINSLICTWAKRNDVGPGPGWRGIFGKWLTSSQSLTSLKLTWSTCKKMVGWKMMLLFWDSGIR